MSKYQEATPIVERNALEVWEVMLKAGNKMVKAICAKNFEKFISMANKNNRDAFFDEVCLLFLLLSFSISNYVDFFFDRCTCHVSNQLELLHQHCSGYDNREVVEGSYVYGRARIQGQIATLVEFLCKCPNQQQVPL